MQENYFNEADVVMETFKLLMTAFSLKNRQFGREKQEKTKRFKAYRKKFYILFCINSKKNCTLSDLEKMLIENRSTTSAAVSKLYKDGLISKNQPEKDDDGRKVYFGVTQKGKEILNMFFDCFRNDVKEFYRGLSEENKKNYTNGIISLNKVFE